MASIAVLALAIATALLLPSTVNADGDHSFGGPCVRITMVSADADYKLHLVNENETKLGLNNRQVGRSIILTRAPKKIGILIEQTGDVEWEHEHDEANGQIGFEDGVDTDYNDAVIRVEPVSCPSRNSGPAPTATPTPTPTATPTPTPTALEVSFDEATPAPRANRRSAGGNSGGGGGGFTAPKTNQPPVFIEGGNAARSVAENAEIPTLVGSPVLATDPDRDTLTYTMGGPDSSSFTLDSSTGQLKTATELDYETKVAYFVIVYAHDARGGRDTIVVAVGVTDVVEGEVVFDAPSPTPEPQPVATATSEPEPTVMPTPAPTATPTPAPTATSVPTPTVSLRWPWHSQAPDPTPGPLASAMSTSTPEPRPTEEPTTVPEDTSDSQSAMFVGSQGGGPPGDFQPLSVRSSITPLPEEPRHLLVWPIALEALGLAVMVIGIGMLIAGGRKRRRIGNRDFIMNS